MAEADTGARFALVLRLARQVTGRHDLDDVLTETFRCLRPLVSFGGGSIQLLDDDGWIQMAAADPVAPEHVMAQRIPLGSSVAGRVILTEQPVYLPDIEAHLNAQGNKSVSTGVRSYLGVPLVADGRAIGVLQIDSPQVDAWTSADRDFVICAAPSVAAAIQNARAHVRASASRARSESLEKRLSDARHLIAAARNAVRSGDRSDLERQLARIDALLAGENPATLLQLPRQRDEDILPLAR